MFTTRREFTATTSLLVLAATGFLGCSSAIRCDGKVSSDPALQLFYVGGGPAPVIGGLSLHSENPPLLRYRATSWKSYCARADDDDYKRLLAAFSSDEITRVLASARQGEYYKLHDGSGVDIAMAGETYRFTSCFVPQELKNLLREVDAVASSALRRRYEPLLSRRVRGCHLPPDLVESLQTAGRKPN